MKTFLKQFLKYYLKFFTKLALIIHKPYVIAIAGSTNKTFVKESIKNTLKGMNFSVRANPKNFNTEIGLPLSILSLGSGYNSYKNWLPIIYKTPFSIFKQFPQYLVLELGVSDKGDMKYLLSIIKPKIFIITDISQRYLEGFSGMDHLVDEYINLAKNSKKNNYLILNQDNSRIRKISKYSKAKLIYFGIKNEADYRAKNVKETGEGQSFIIKSKGKEKEHFIKRYGEHHIYSFLISTVVKDIL